MVQISPNHKQAQIMDKRTYVRYEDMLVHEDAPRAILYDFFYSHCISKKPEFKKQETYTSWNRGSGKKLSSSAFEAENKQRLSESSFIYGRYCNGTHWQNIQLKKWNSFYHNLT